MLALGLVTTAWSVYAGQIRFYLVVIIPVLTSDDAWGSLPLLAIFAGIVLMALAPALGKNDPDTSEPEDSGVDAGTSHGRTDIGGVVLIGPIPILFGSDGRMALIAAGIAILILALLVLLL